MPRACPEHAQGMPVVTTAGHESVELQQKQESSMPVVTTAGHGSVERQKKREVRLRNFSCFGNLQKLVRKNIKS